MIKLVTIDLDGTLFDKDKNVSKENLEAIKKCHSLGVKIVIATGRPYNGIYKLLDMLGLNTINDYTILYNGAKIINNKTKEYFYTSSINGKMVKEIYNESIRFKVNCHAFRINEELITPKHNPYTDVEATINKIEDHIFDFNQINDDDQFLKCMLVDEKENLDYIEKNLNKEYFNRFTIVRSANIFLEFLNKTSGKGEALINLAKFLDIDMHDTMAIGDAGNDKTMIKFAKIGVVMQNATNDVKGIADYITINDNNSSGVAEALNKFIINETGAVKKTNF